MFYTISAAVWFILTICVGAVMWATQVGPKEAVSNLSEWAIWFGIENPPDWLKAKSLDRLVRRRAAIVLAVLLVIGGFMGGMTFEDYLKTSESGTSTSSISPHWQQLTSQETVSLREEWRTFSPIRLGVLCAIPSCADLAESIYDVAKDLNWPALYQTTYFQDNGIQHGIELWSYSNHITERDKLASSIERATNGRLEISTHTWEQDVKNLPPDFASGINIVIGRPK